MAKNVPLGVVLGLLLGAIAASCGPNEPYDDVERCRFDPDDCFGGIGGFCDEDDDCATGYCCRDEANCDGGMCSIPCDHDDECPSDMLCQHHKCFFACDHDEDCADGMSCEHDHTVCEWP